MYIYTCEPDPWQGSAELMVEEENSARMRIVNGATRPARAGGADIQGWYAACTRNLFRKTALCNLQLAGPVSP